MGLPVVIAAHPRAGYAQAGYSGPDYFGGRTLVSGQTLPLIFDSALVLTHYSTAVNFAVMARKPLLLLASDTLVRVLASPHEVATGIMTRILGGLLLLFLLVNDRQRAD